MKKYFLMISIMVVFSSSAYGATRKRKSAPEDDLKSVSSTVEKMLKIESVEEEKNAELLTNLDETNNLLTSLEELKNLANQKIRNKQQRIQLLARFTQFTLNSNQLLESFSSFENQDVDQIVANWKSSNTQALDGLRTTPKSFQVIIQTAILSAHKNLSDIVLKLTE